MISENINRWMKGDTSAIDWVSRLLDVIAVWDDLIDDDKDVSAPSINYAFSSAILWMPTNPFYLRHQIALHPHLVSALRNWQTANAMEEEGKSLEVAFVIRSSYIDAIVVCAALLGGYEWSELVNREAREFFHAEGFQEYLSSLEAEKRNRDVRRRKREPNND